MQRKEVHSPLAKSGHVWYDGKRVKFDPVAQWIRAFPCGGKGRAFESHQGRQAKRLLRKLLRSLFYSRSTLGFCDLFGFAKKVACFHLNKKAPPHGRYFCFVVSRVGLEPTTG